MKYTVRRNYKKEVEISDEMDSLELATELFEQWIASGRSGTYYIVQIEDIKAEKGLKVRVPTYIREETI